jgi:hypothetical protein
MKAAAYDLEVAVGHVALFARSGRTNRHFVLVDVLIRFCAHVKVTYTDPRS